MKRILLGFLGLACGTAMAVTAPTITEVQADDSGNVTVTWNLPERAIVTARVVVDGQTRHLRSVVGDVNRLLDAGNGKSFTWCAKGDLDGGTYDASAMSFTLTAWDVATPPPYMGVPVYAPAGVQYFASSNAVPGGVRDRRWKEDWMLFARIPAKDVTWRAGCASGDYCWNTGELSDASKGPQPLRYVTTTRDFYLGVYEVTQRQYQRMTNNLKPSRTNADSWNALPNSSHYAVHKNDWGWHPVEQVTWHAVTNCLAKMTERAAGAATFGLPTALEWEFAARGETASGTYNGSPHNPTTIAPIGINYQSSESYYGGKNGVAHPNYTDPCPVGIKRPNRYGLYDMVGNVQEWCDDVYAEGSMNRCVKGGGVEMSGEGHGVGYTTAMAPGSSSWKVGFRVACAIPPAE